MLVNVKMFNSAFCWLAQFLFLPRISQFPFIHNIVSSKYVLQYIRKKWIYFNLQPENLMLKGIGGGQEKIVKLIDFGLSRQINPGQIVREMVGTPEFVAPESKNKKHKI